ncbi:hypothetical protein Pse7429DRAFT_1423 [Pseudanabaena biceps PCC 7429]|uniref:Uncharacterized protein n=1 Tax=Pseudanabaena biceps PCC 7429 TaxID=927668 RepID=L8MZW0_9CYAN|nr:hypothetical protein Pse7429DRAFT_1423 [Pseudanabaena biceps PCC 7429]
MRQHFWELKAKPSNDFQSSKWLRHFELWYKTCAACAAGFRVLYLIKSTYLELVNRQNLNLELLAHCLLMAEPKSALKAFRQEL